MVFSIDFIISTTESINLTNILSSVITSAYFMLNLILTVWAILTINRTQKAVYHPTKTSEKMIPSDERN